MTSNKFVTYLPSNCPDKLRKLIDDCSCSSDVLDTLLKVIFLIKIHCEQPEKVDPNINGRMFLLVFRRFEQ